MKRKGLNLIRRKRRIDETKDLVSTLFRNTRFTIQADLKSKILVITVISDALFQKSLSFCLASTFSAGVNTTNSAKVHSMLLPHIGNVCKNIALL